MLIDTHAHLTSARFSGQVGEIIQRADEAGVKKIITIACDLPDSEKVIKLAAAHDCVFPTVGIHPCYVHEIEPSDWLDILRELAGTNPVAAIGEIGLDYFHEPPEGYSVPEWREKQAEVFEKQLILATELDLPVVIHTRKSGDDVISILKRHPEVRAVLHCFSGSMEQAEEALKLGHYLSFTGVVTYPKAPKVQAVATNVPEDRFMVETDSPYLTPVPFRGKSNESAYVSYIASKIAQLRGITDQECARITTQNAHRFFQNIGNGTS